MFFAPSHKSPGAAMKQKWTPVPPDPGIKPGGMRDRAMQAVLARGPRPPETPEELQRAQDFWAKFRAEQAKRAGTAHEPNAPSKTAQRPAEAGSHRPTEHEAAIQE
jgi:hypothetical protein